MQSTYVRVLTIWVAVLVALFVFERWFS